MGHKIKPVEYKPSDVERFWSKVDRSGDCWLWQASLTRSGYGRFGLKPVGWVLSHRFAFVVANGPIAERLELHHVCENRACVRPDHLRAVTHREHDVYLSPNNLHGQNALKTHCIHGHEFTPENTYRWAGAPEGRTCKTCRRERGHARYRERADARKAQGIFGKRNVQHFTCPLCRKELKGRVGFEKHMEACKRGRLMGAARDLLEACRRVTEAERVLVGILNRKLPGWRQGYTFGEMFAQAREAVAKAEGEPCEVCSKPILPSEAALARRSYGWAVCSECREGGKISPPTEATEP